MIDGTVRSPDAVTRARLDLAKDYQTVERFIDNPPQGFITLYTPQSMLRGPLNRGRMLMGVVTGLRANEYKMMGLRPFNQGQTQGVVLKINPPEPNKVAHTNLASVVGEGGGLNVRFFDIYSPGFQLTPMDGLSLLPSGSVSLSWPERRIAGFTEKGDTAIVAGVVGAVARAIRQGRVQPFLLRYAEILEGYLYPPNRGSYSPVTR